MMWLDAALYFVTQTATEKEKEKIKLNKTHKTNERSIGTHYTVLQYDTNIAIKY